MKTEEIKTCSREKAGPARRMPGLLLVMTLIGIAFTGGVWVGHEMDGVVAVVQTAVLTTCAQPAEEAEDTLQSRGPVAPGVLLSALQAQLRQLKAEQTRLTGEHKENQIHYGLLRSRGYAKGSSECVELHRRQQDLVAKLDAISSTLGEGRAMEESLIESMHENSSSGVVTAIDEELRKGIERHLNRGSLFDGATPQIPDEIWADDGDSYMEHSAAQL